MNHEPENAGDTTYADITNDCENGQTEDANMDHEPENAGDTTYADITNDCENG